MSQLVLGSSLKEFFKLLVGQVASRQKVALGDFTEFYIVNLLSEFAAADKLFSPDSEGQRGPVALAGLYQQALAQEREERLRTLRRLGDVSLYTAVFFSDSLKSRAVGEDYYIEMGGRAYASLAQQAQASTFSSVYLELHEKFRSIVRVLEEIAARGMCANGASGTVRVFESWTRCGSEHLGQVLLEAGMIPKGVAN